MAAVRRSLDIPEMQMLVEFPGDPNNLDYHHRISWYRVERSEWIISTPDGDVYEEDYAGVTVVPLTRNAPYPAAYAGQLYVPDNDALMRDYQDLKRQAEALSVVRGCQDRPGVSAAEGTNETAGQWRVADVDSKKFGEIIPNNELMDGGSNVMLEIGEHRKRLHHKDGEIMTLEYVKNFDEWAERKRPGLPGGDAGDLRILGCVKLSSGKRQMSLERALELMSEKKFEDFPHRGPRAAREFLESVLENGGDLALQPIMQPSCGRVGSQITLQRHMSTRTCSPCSSSPSAMTRLTAPTWHPLSKSYEGSLRFKLLCVGIHATPPLMLLTTTHVEALMRLWGQGHLAMLSGWQSSRSKRRRR